MKIAIAGAGKLGIKIAESLLVGNHSITVIDKNEDVIQKLINHMDVLTITANAKEISVYKEMNIASYDYFIAVTDKDEKNIVIASFAKKLGCPKVIARVRDPEHMNQIEFIKENMGIDYIVNPDLAITLEIYKYLVEKYSLSNGIFSSGQASLLEFPTRKMPELIGTSMFDIGQKLPGMLMVAISRNGKVIVPHGSTAIQKGDGLYVIGESQVIAELAEKVHEKGQYTNLQKVMIIGGGKTGLYLAKKLAAFGIKVKIIERDKARCHYLATHLENVMILHGDATDIGLLEEENLNDMDAVVTATGFDEENLLLALTAKHHDIEDVIAKVSRESYIELIEKMGIDMALNPLNITCANVLRFVQGSKRVLSSQLIQGQAEVMEIVAAKGMPLVGIPLKKLKLPDGVIIAAIHRGSKVIIPNGDTKILENDRVIILCLLSELPDLEKLISSSRLSFFNRGKLI